MCYRERRRYTFEGALTTLCVFAVVVLSLYSLYVERQQVTATYRYGIMRT